MRPDEHKKKKSTQYKKKHGMKEESLQANESKSKGNKKSHNSQASNTRSSDVRIPIGDDQKTKQEFTNDEEITEVFSGFSKRKVESNWERYESLKDDSDEEIGTDFNVLLSFAGSSSSFMKLESEKEWDEDSKSDFSCLTIDCQRLAAGLDDLSFMEKYKLDQLGVDPDILELVASINKEDLENQSPENVLSSAIAHEMGFDFTKPNQADGSSKHLNLNSEKEPPRTLQTNDKFLELHSSIISNSKDNIGETVKKEKSDRDVRPASHVESIEDNQYPKDTIGSNDSTEVVVGIKKEQRSGKYEDISTNDDMSTDFMDSNDVKSSMKKENEIESQKTIEADLEDDLDNLLQGSKGGKATSTVISLPSIPKAEVPDSGKNIEDSEADNLEDWLDSIL